MDVCLRVLRQFRQLQRQEQCVDHIPLITFLDCRVHIFPTTFLEIAVEYDLSLTTCFERIV